jgi:phosphoribosylformimino-5-aminoimidazole carboxamide ribotide isomerase
MFRPCIDLHEGKVKQIVGGTLGALEDLRTNFISEKPAAWFAKLYKRDGLTGGHVIMLGADNESAARSALAEFPNGLQIGGGINAQRATGLRPERRTSLSRAGFSAKDAWIGNGLAKL